MFDPGGFSFYTFLAITAVLSAYHSADLAELLGELGSKDLVLVFRLIAKEKAAEVFLYMENDTRQTLIAEFSKQEIHALLGEMFADDAVDFLSDMPANVVTQLLENIDKETRAEINHHCGHLFHNSLL